MLWRCSTPSRSGFLDATTSGPRVLSGKELAPVGAQATPCSFTTLRTASQQATLCSFAVGKGRDDNWGGAVDGLRITRFVHGLEAEGVRARRVG
ncbi:hypothetical protein [Actinacidiphila sp. bgisy167]|uniref:hypothetical protein n=1 Tax=Actinacidiphila sp. bgisy167 TaxID=3413797 RepID=UPI003D712125